MTRGAGLPGAFSTLADHVAELAAHGSRPALALRGRYRTRRWSYRELGQAVQAAAARLAGCGVGPGERVLLRGPDSPEWTASMLACVHLGAAAVPLERSLAPDLAERAARRAGPAAAVLADDDPWEPGVPRIPLAEIRPGPPAGKVPEVHRAAPDEILELVFTSGTTGDPRGVIITHGNVLAYVERIWAGYLRRRRWVDPFLPLPLLCLPPLSHLFGQAVGIFLPLRLGCTVVHLEAQDPGSVRRALREERIVLMMAVPRMMEMLARSLRAEAAGRGWHLDRLVREGDHRSLVARAWAARRVQRWLGWRLRGFVVGGAALDPDLDRFWRALGYVLVQGYGLTETAPVVTLTHPFRGRAGTVGRPLGGQEVRLAGDGEILVRGANVMAGYWQDPSATRQALDSEGWLHTGDLGRRDEDGQLRIVGRKKEIIVPAEGRNVHPEEVERELRRVEGVRDAAVVGRPGPRGEEVHAVLLLAPQADGADVVAEANRALPAFARIRGFTVWEGADLPRTATGKVRRRAVTPAGAGEGAIARDPLAGLLAELGIRDDPPREEASLEELGLSSLDLVELGAALEERLGVGVEDGQLTARSSVADLRRLAGGGSGGAPPRPGLAVPLPRWPRRPWARILRRALRDGVIGPALAAWTPLRVEGREHLRSVSPPALIIANHVSALDVPVLLRALPGHLRRRVAPAMTAEYYRPWLSGAGGPLRRASLRLQFLLASLLYEAFLLPRGQGFREILRHAGAVADDGASPLVFPEGRRGQGPLMPFQAGTGLMAVRLQLPVIPAHLQGMTAVLPADRRWPRRSPVRARFGAPLRLPPELDPREATRRMEEAVRALAP